MWFDFYSILLTKDAECCEVVNSKLESNLNLYTLHNILLEAGSSDFEKHTLKRTLFQLYEGETLELGLWN